MCGVCLQMGCNLHRTEAGHEAVLSGACGDSSCDQYARSGDYCELDHTHTHLAHIEMLNILLTRKLKESLLSVLLIILCASVQRTMHQIKLHVLPVPSCTFICNYFCDLVGRILESL